MTKSNEFQTNYGYAISRVYDDSRRTLAVDVEGNAFKNIVETSTTVVSRVAGTLVGISVNTAAAGAITVYDGLNVGGSKIGILKASIAEGFYPLPCNFATGLTVTTAHADLDITVFYRPESSVQSSSSGSASSSKSASKSESLSTSASDSPSASGSASASKSASPSASESASASKSASPSASESASGSTSLSPSASDSASESASDSKSGSASESTSQSPSASGSKSGSKSASRSVSPSEGM